MIRTSVIIEILLYMLIGGASYYVYGDDNTPDLLILRPENASRLILNRIITVFLLIFFLINNLGMAIFVPTIRSYLKKTSFFKF